MGGINESISEMLNDPLDEWHLDLSPRYSAEDREALCNASADPFKLSQPYLEKLDASIRSDLISTDHPVLHKAASYFFSSSSAAVSGKKIRPMMVMLLSHAMMPRHPSLSDVRSRQYRLAEISEMIHTASLFHDDVIDGADMRRGAPSVHSVFGNKMAILAGDYLLAR